VKLRHSAESVIPILFLALIILAFAGTIPTAPAAYADNNGTEPLPTDPASDSTSTAPDGYDGSDEDSTLDLLLALVNALL
jgi:hypothetical protein